MEQRHYIWIKKSGDENIYSSIIYSSGPENVEHVFVEGEQVIDSGKSTIYDEEKLVQDGKSELNDLIKRASV